MENIDFKEMNKIWNNLTEEDKQQIRKNRQKKLEEFDELAKIFPPKIIADDRRRYK